ncbi:MAG: hypothetical protein QOD99_1801 [Chthoniobacter sp.]|nr:hypothetical protein [Chthoniobacter sp.]
MSTHFFEKQVSPTGELRILTGVLRPPTDGTYHLDFTVLDWVSSKSNSAETTYDEKIELDKPCNFLTGQSAFTVHVLLLTKHKTP